MAKVLVMKYSLSSKETSISTYIDVGCIKTALVKKVIIADMLLDVWVPNVGKQ